MKLLSSATSRITLLLLTFLISFVAFAQEGGADVKVDINKDSGGGGSWYANPIVWIVGAAVFILLLVALLRGNSSRD